MPLVVRLAPPLQGECLVLHPPGHSVSAFDLIPLVAGSGQVARGGWLRYLAGQIRPTDVAGWGRPVFAPLAGEVLASHDGEADRDRLLPWLDVPRVLLIDPLRHGREAAMMAGNHVLIGSGGAVVLLAHLRRGSIRVHTGATVDVGQHLGEVGVSGNALGPHLHLQLMDGPDPLSARPVPFVVRSFAEWTRQDWLERREAPLPRRAARLRFDQPTRRREDHGAEA